MYLHIMSRWLAWSSPNIILNVFFIEHKHAVRLPSLFTSHCSIRKALSITTRRNKSRNFLMLIYMVQNQWLWWKYVDALFVIKYKSKRECQNFYDKVRQNFVLLHNFITKNPILPTISAGQLIWYWTEIVILTWNGSGTQNIE